MLVQDQSGERRSVRIGGEHIAREFIIKINSKCSLACDYCYMYNGPGAVPMLQSPGRMSSAVMRKVAQRLGEYSREHPSLTHLNVVLHGGEPLLSGVGPIEEIVGLIRQAVIPEVALRFNMQTNGVLLTPTVLDVLKGLGVTLGISIDGTEKDNRHRPLLGGKSSHSRVVEALELFADPAYADMLRIILAVMHLDVIEQGDPIETYDFLARFKPKKIDFLFPIASWSQQLDGYDPWARAMPFAKWLIAAYNRASETGGPPIRIMDQLVELAMAEALGDELDWEQQIEVVGPWRMGAIAIDTKKGEYETLDGHRRISPDGHKLGGLNVWQDIATRALATVLQEMERRGITAGAQVCQTCPFFKTCGGGLYLQRRDADDSYDNPSYFCTDMQGLMQSILSRLEVFRGDDLATYRLTHQLEEDVRGVAVVKRPLPLPA